MNIISKIVKHFLFISTGIMLVLNSPMKSWKMKIPFSQDTRFHVIAASLWSVETCLCKGIKTGLTIAPVLETLWLSGLEVDTSFTFQILSYGYKNASNRCIFPEITTKKTWKQHTIVVTLLDNIQLTEMCFKYLWRIMKGRGMIYEIYHVKWEKENHWNCFYL